MEALRSRLARVQRPVETSLSVFILATFVAELLFLGSPARLRVVYGLLVAAWVLFLAYEAVIKGSPWLGAAGLVAAAATEVLQAVAAYRSYGLFAWLGVLGVWFLLWRRPVNGTENRAGPEPAGELRPAVAPDPGEAELPAPPGRPRPGDPTFQYPSPPPGSGRR